MRRIDAVRPSLADDAYTQITDAILAGELAPGSRLLMDDLADRLGISRTPVRQALQRLEMERVIEPAERRGYLIRELTDHELDLQYEARAAVEPFALAEVARRGGETAAYVRAAYERLVQTSQSTPAEVFAVNRSIHRSTVEALHNEYLLNMFDTVWQTALTSTVWADIFEAHRIGDFAEQHLEIVEAAESGDPALATTVARKHIATGRGLHAHSEHHLQYLTQ